MERDKIQWQFRAKYFKAAETRYLFQFCHELALWAWVNLLITVTPLRPKLCNLVSKAEKFNWMNIFSHPSVTQSKLSLPVSPSSHLAIWGEPTKISSSVFTRLRGTFFLMSFFHLFSLFHHLSTSTQMLVIKCLFKGIGTDFGGIWREGIPLCLLPFQSLVLPLEPIWMSGPSTCPPRFCEAGFYAVLSTNWSEF